MILHIVIDISGSMLENGKIMIARGLARAAEQYFRLGYGQAEVRLASWGKEAREIPWNPDSELPAEISASAESVDAAALISFFEARPEDGVLLLTDCFWSPEDSRKLRHWMEASTPNAPRVIKIGTDANRRRDKDKTFSAEDLFSVLEGFAT